MADLLDVLLRCGRVVSVCSTCGSERACICWPNRGRQDTVNVRPSPVVNTTSAIEQPVSVTA